MGSKTRRQFLRSVALGGTTAGLGSLANSRIYGEQTDFSRIVYRELGSTGCRVSEIGFGAMNMRDQELLEAAIDYGINYIDTAWYYMNGVNEQVVGRAVKGKRDKLFITTKVLPARPGESTDVMMRNMETSLRRLDMDHVDLMLLHAVDSRDAVLNDGFMEIIGRAREKGMCRFVGVSTHANHDEVIKAAVDSKFWEVVLTGYNYMSPPSVTESIKMARKAGLGIIAMKNLLNPIDLATWNWEQIPDIRKDKNSPVTPTQALIKWVLDNQYVDTTIPGMTSFEQLAEDVNIMGLRMSFEDSRDIHRYGKAINRSYCRGLAGCTGCLEQCPYGVRISDINRCLAYATGYRNPGLAREQYNLVEETVGLDNCANCDECQVSCLYGLNLTEHIQKAKEFFA